MAGCCSGCCRLLQCIRQMSGRWLVVAVVVVVYEQMNERWLVVAGVVVGCCSVLADG